MKKLILFLMIAIVFDYAFDQKINIMGLMAEIGFIALYFLNKKFPNQQSWKEK